MRNLPETPGVYIMKDARGHFLYIGKAGNLRKRVASYFIRPREYRIHKLISEVKKIDCKKTDTVLEALILESALIKKYQPQFNIRDKDGKSFLYVEFTKEEFPRVLLVRGRSDAVGERFGPFVSAGALRTALKILRRIFPYSVHPPETIGKFKRRCFEAEIGLCPGVCVGRVSKTDYAENIRRLKLIFKGRKTKIINDLKRQMAAASKIQEYEKAAKIKNQIFGLEHIHDIALLKDSELGIGHNEAATRRENFRIEGYDISNIAGSLAVGAMAVFIGANPAKSEYRKFKIRTIEGPNDVGMLREVLRRRFKNFWPPPNLILVDGGQAQVNVAKETLLEFGLKIPVVGIAKGPARKNNKFFGSWPAAAVEKNALIRVRDEAHRFAKSYHKKLRQKEMLRA